MMSIASLVLRAPTHTPLAASIMTMFALTAPAANSATIWHVNTCAEGVSGNSTTRTGTLRFALANAASGLNSATSDIVVIALPSSCHSTISLTTGALAVTQNFLDIVGPPGRVTITAQGSPVKDRIVTHTGNGTLTLTNLNLQDGQAATQSSEHGGCIYSKSSISLYNAGVYDCSAKSASIGGTAYGGGVFTAKDLRLNYSTLSGNGTAAATAVSSGGGAYVRGYLFSRYSTISYNKANGIYGRGGGVYLAGKGANIGASTISGNTARKDFGGVALRGSLGATITNSTISGNTATEGVVGGLYASVPLTLQNSTIAFNSAALGMRNGHYTTAGVAIGQHSGTLGVTLRSTLISNNTYMSGANVVASDFSTGGTLDFGSSADNLVYAAPGLALTGIATTGACPLLGPLRDNGGQTWTHQLLSHSSAIDAGDNVAALNSDQRGTPFKRESGPAGFTPVADIGAYEVQRDDVIFNSSFDGCPSG